MRLEIFNDGKELQDIKDAKAFIQPEYYGVSTIDGHTWREENITLAFGDDNYWWSIIKFKDKDECKDFIRRLQEML